MMKKRIGIMLFAVAFVLSLAACGSKERETVIDNSEEVIQGEQADQTKTDETSAAKDDAGVQTENDVGLSPDAETDEMSDVKDDAAIKTESEGEVVKMNVQIGDYTFKAGMEENEAVNELITMMKENPVTIEMSDYSGFEKVGSLGKTLTASNKQTTTSAGDIVLYNGNQIVIFYGSNSWSYTRLGKIEDLSNWEKALGTGDVTVTFSIAE